MRLPEVVVDWNGLRKQLAALARDAGIETQDPGIRPLMDGARLPGMETLRAEMERVLSEAEIAGADGPVNEALVRWLPEDAPVSVLSLNSRRAVDAALELHGLAKRVEHVVAREDVDRGKPDPEGLRVLAGLHSVETGRMLLIGDAETDRLAAERAGAAFLHVNDIGMEWRRPSSAA